jgi:hypothetical protein
MIDAIGRKYNQESVLHSGWKKSDGDKGVHHNELRYMDGRPSVFGKGYRLAPEAEDYYTEHPEIGKFQMHLDFPSDKDETEKAVTSSGSVSIQTAAPGPEVRPSKPVVSKPEKTQNPPRPKYKKGPIVSSKTPAESPDSKESPAKPTAEEKSKSLAKTLLHQDGETLIDTRAHAAALTALPPSMIKWGAAHLTPMKLNEAKELKLGDCTIKIVKKSPDLYNGWIEKEANIGHKFERLTMPQVLMQLQSSLETYGREDQVFTYPEKTESESIEEKVDPDTSTVLGKNSQADKQALILEKLESLRKKIKVEEIPSKDLAKGIENPEKSCPACESSSEDCSCYVGLSAPKLEFDGKNIKLFFKSDWSTEDKDNFKEDLKRRAGIILRKREESRKSKK